MAAYILADVPPDDLDAYRASGYLEEAKRLATQHGGEYLVRGGETTVLEGEWEPDRMVIIRFPSMDDLRSFYHSEEYQEWVKVRQAHVPRSRLVAIEGAD